MTFIADILGMLAFRTNSLRAQAERRALITGVICYSVGYLAYAVVRNLVYASLPEVAPLQLSLFSTFFNFQLIQTLIFILVVYVPALIVLGNAISGDGLGFSFSRKEYQAHSSALLCLWGMLYLITAPLQWLLPHFLIFGLLLEISLGKIICYLLLVVYTFWAVKHLNYLSAVQTVGVLAISIFALPIYYILISFIFALPFFLGIPVAYFAYQWIRGYVTSQTSERSFQQQLRALTLNPQDADAQYQLGLISLKRRNLITARKYFENAIQIDPNDPDYHYSLGRAHELDGAWDQALGEYEETYRLNPEYGLGDIFREVGKAYLHTGSVDKGIEFLNFFLSKRGSDPEGRYWLAVALQKAGDSEQMRAQLNMIVEQARSHPRFFRKENREWVFRARGMIRDSKSEIRG
jgi:tetratricopeptide (TPR) repeat protein